MIMWSLLFLEFGSCFSIILIIHIYWLVLLIIFCDLAFPEVKSSIDTTITLLFVISDFIMSLVIISTVYSSVYKSLSIVYQSL